MPRRVLFLDTETTGLPPRRGEGSEWPHITQLGFMLVCDGREAALFHSLIEPDGWEIPDDIARLTGITTQMCRDTGIPIADALLLFKQYNDMVGAVVAHNYEFDSAILDKEMSRLGFLAEMFSDVRQFCTMKAATQIVKAKGQNSRGSFNKYPKLHECYSFFTGREMAVDGFVAHTAIGDVRACRVIYDHILQTR